MKIGLAHRDAGIHLVAVADDRVIGLRASAEAEGVEDRGGFLNGLAPFLRAESAAHSLALEVLDRLSDRDQLPAVEATRFAPPYVPGATVFCHVINYPSHGPAGIPSRPFFFLKPASAVIGHKDAIEPHVGLSAELDWETELAVVIGREGRDVAAERAYEHVAGYTILNDVSHRDLQFNRHAPDLSTRYGMNWLQGKGLDGSCPLGPWIVLRDEMSEPYPLRIRTLVNGEVRQEATTDAMHYRVPDLVAEASRGVTLRPGDIIATGSPPGTGLDAGPYLRPGDVVRCEIERIGALESPIGPA